HSHTHSFPTRRSSDLHERRITFQGASRARLSWAALHCKDNQALHCKVRLSSGVRFAARLLLQPDIPEVDLAHPELFDLQRDHARSEEHTSELQSLAYL